MKNMLVIFSGYNQRAVIAFLRALNINKIYDYVIIAASEEDSILKTSYKDKVFLIRKNKNLDKQEVFSALKKLRQIYRNRLFVIVPTTEFLNRFCLEYRDEFEKNQCIIPLVERELYEQFSDKEAFWNLCKSSHLDVPEKIEISEKFTKPYVAKPKRYAAKDGKIYSPVIVLSGDDHSRFLQNYPIEDFFCQEYVTGSSYYLLYYFSPNGQVEKFSQINFAQQPGGKSILAAMPSEIHKEAIGTEYVLLLKRLNYVGLIMIELRKSKETYYMIEANPRFWGPSQLFVDAEIPFFEMFLYDQKIIKDVSWGNVCSNMGAKYLWSGGCVDDLLRSDSCCWLGDGKQRVVEDWNDYLKADIYKREDTMRIFEIEELKRLYMQVSKHSNYQILPCELAKILGTDQLFIKSRQERERLDYMLEHVDFRDKRVLDIGGNTGFFTFKVLKNGARHVDYYEGNETHAEFVALAATVLGLEDQITVHPEYYLFHEQIDQYDIILNLNVVHHLGDDFGAERQKEHAKQKMLFCINSLACYANCMIFQMGFNWQGNPNDGLFENGTKEEMEKYLEQGAEGYWKITNTGIAVMRNDEIFYEDRNEQNNVRIDIVGEFLNRPIFIMKSETICKEN